MTRDDISVSRACFSTSWSAIRLNAMVSWVSCASVNGYTRARADVFPSPNATMLDSSSSIGRSTMRVTVKISARATATPATVSAIAMSQCGPCGRAATCSVVTQNTKTASVAAPMALTATSR